MITLEILSSRFDDEKGAKRTFFFRLRNEQSLIEIIMFQNTKFYEANSSRCGFLLIGIRLGFIGFS
jgi:hypothetical protein